MSMRMNKGEAKDCELSEVKLFRFLFNIRDLVKLLVS